MPGWIPAASAGVGASLAFDGVTFTLDASNAGNRDVTMQLTLDGSNVTVDTILTVALSVDSDTFYPNAFLRMSLTSSILSGGESDGVGIVMFANDGTADLTIYNNESEAKAGRLVVLLPDGNVASSGSFTVDGVFVP